MISSFYFLTNHAYITLCQVVYQTSYALCYDDLIVLAVFETQLSFLFLLFCVYYGVEHYMVHVPREVKRVPEFALRLCFSKALNKLAYRLSTDSRPLKAYACETITMPSGANVFEIKYYPKEDWSTHKGPLFNGRTSYTLMAEISVHTTDLYPVTKVEERCAYLNQRLDANPLVNQLVLPRRPEAESGVWIPEESVRYFN